MEVLQMQRGHQEVVLLAVQERQHLQYEDFCVEIEALFSE
jgi:hypothetical protein